MYCFGDSVVFWDVICLSLGKLGRKKGRRGLSTMLWNQNELLVAFQVNIWF